MSAKVPADPVIAGHVNDAGVPYNPLIKTRLFAEELAHLRGLTSGEYTGNVFSSFVNGVERMTEDGDTLARGLVAEGSTGPLFATPGAGTKFIFYPGKRAFRFGTVSGDAWDDANIDTDTIAIGRDVEAAPGTSGAIVIGSGVDDANRLAASSGDEILIGQGSDLPTIRLTAGSGAGTTGLTGVGLGALTPTALLDVGASTTARASLRLRDGVAPTTPASGDLWYESGLMKWYDGAKSRSFGEAGSVQVEVWNAGSHVLTDANIGRFHNNDSAAGLVSLTLPFAVVGMVGEFLNMTTFGITIKAAGGDVIRVENEETTTINTVAPGSWLRLVAVDGTYWYATSKDGVWFGDFS